MTDEYRATGVVALAKRAIADALIGDGDVSRLAPGGVFDIPPQDSRSPSVRPAYVFLGPVGVRGAARGPCQEIVLDTRFRVFVASALPHREEAWDIALAVIAALQSKRLRIGENRAMSDLQLENAGDVVDALEPVLVFADFTTRLQQ